MIEIKTGKEVLIDYFTCTFEFYSIDDEKELEVVDEIVETFSRIFKIPQESIYEKEFGKGNYRYVYELEEGITLKICGPLNSRGMHTNSLEMKGEGCRNFERHNGKENWYLFLLTMSAQFDAQCTHIDLTINDYDGNIVSFDWLKDKLEREMEAIISEEIWNKTRIKRQERGILQESRIGYVRTHLLSGLMRCPKCGGPMYAQKTLIPTSMENTLNTLTISV